MMSIFGTSLLILNIVYGTNIICDHNVWSIVRGGWTFDGCSVDDAIPEHSSMVWIGEVDKSTLEWSDYTIKATFKINDATGNGGVAFHVQTVADATDGGQYYALSFFANQDTVVFGKWDNTFIKIIEFNSETTITAYVDYNVEISCSSNNEFTFKVEGKSFGPYSDNAEGPTYPKGSVGFRNYYMPMSFSNLEVILPDGEYDPVESLKNSGNPGGWIFVGCVLGILFLYCLIGYIINGRRSKNWGDFRGNIPNYYFWLTLPKWCVEGCCITKECIMVKCCKKGSTDETPLASDDAGTGTSNGL